MNGELSISVENLCKCYMLYDRPQDRLKQSLFRHFGKRYGRELWALWNVSFVVQRGETLGIIGRNGSGKSTLLQIIAGILVPTDGKVVVNGRVAALLELGSGFNPEYTGRENIFMNGAIMGIPIAEMKERVEEIISFSEIGEFIDQPVKVYSSGMFIRLAFAVTTGLNANILLIDEALAVGDVFFRQKCYRRLETLREKGVSIVLVSHAMNEVEQFCQRALLLNQGDLIYQGTASEAVKRYYLFGRGHQMLPMVSPIERLPNHDQSVIKPDSGDRLFWPSSESFLDISGITQISNGWARCTGVALCNEQGEPCSVFQQGETASFFYEFEILQGLEVPTAGVELQNEKGVLVHGKSTLEYGTEVPTHLAPGNRLKFRQDIGLEIAVGEYTFNIGMGSMLLQDFQHQDLFPHVDLDAKLTRVCLITSVGQFAVVFRKDGRPVQLMHHGVANLPGKCQVEVDISKGIPSRSPNGM